MRSRIAPAKVLLWTLLIAGGSLLFYNCSALIDNTRAIAAITLKQLTGAVCNNTYYTGNKLTTCKSYLRSNYGQLSFLEFMLTDYGDVRADFEKNYPGTFKTGSSSHLKAHAGSSSACPPIAFQQPVTQFLLDFDNTGNTTFGLELFRQPNGSFSTTGVSITNQTVTTIGTLSQSQNDFVNCNASPWPLVAHPSTLGLIPGSSLRNAIVTNLGGPLPYASVVIGLTTIKVSLDSQTSLGQNITVYPVNGSPAGILAADFNGDGKRDVAALNVGDSSTNGNVAILLGNGDGTLKAAANYPVGMNPTSMTWADFNKDGRADLAITNTTSANVTVLLGNADGTMRVAGTYAVPESYIYGAANQIVAGDFDGDGTPDLIVFTNHNFYLLHGNGDGSFTLKPQLTGYANNYTYSPVYLAAGDVNKDGKLDLISVNYDATVSILLNAGDGSFPNQNRYVAGTPLSMGAAGSPGVFVMDFNDDANPDLVFAAGHPDDLQPDPAAITVIFGNGDGTFQAPPAYAVGSSPSSMVTADFNRDNHPDIVVAAQNLPNTASSSLWLLAGRSGGGFQTPTPIPTATVSTNWVATADLNNDNFADLITVGFNNVTTRLGKGDGTFQAPQTYTLPQSGWFVTAGDVNGDGLQDLVVAYGYPRAVQSATVSSAAVLLTAKPGGGFNPGVNIPTGVNTVQMVLADVNGDNKLDLIAANIGFPQADTPVNGNVTVSLGNGNGTFQPPVSYTVGVAPTWLAVADVNGDNKPDLIVGALDTSQSEIGVLLGNGNGTFGAPTMFATYSYPSMITMADFDKDGHLDIAIVHMNGDSPTSIMRGNGDGTFQAEAFIMSGDTPVAAVAGDFSGTGRQDLAIVTNPSVETGYVGLFQNLSAGASNSGSGVPSVVSSSPASGNVSTATTYTFTFSDTAGYQAINVANVLINNFIDGRHACYLAIVPSSSAVYLVDDAGDAGGPFAGGLTLPGSSTIQNSQCTISGAGSSISGSGNNLTVTLVVSFNSAFAGNRIIYMAAREAAGANSGWQAMGTAGVPGGTVTGPSVTSVNPARMNGNSSTYTFSFSDTNGYTDLGVLNVLINDSLNGSGACYLAYSRSAGWLYLLNDTGTALGNGMALNGASNLSNSQCTVLGAGSSASGSGNTFTLTLNMTFTPSFAGNRVIYVAARSNGDVLNSGWQAVGSVAVH
jgi:hypothetical protein